MRNARDISACGTFVEVLWLRIDKKNVGVVVTTEYAGNITRRKSVAVCII